MLENIAELEAQIREAELEALEAYRKGTADAPTLYRADGYMKAHEDGQPQVFVASEETADRMGDIISVEGWELSSYKKNPVMLLGHDHRIPPIARAGKVWADGKQLLNTVLWDEEDPLGAAIMGKYQRGFMRAQSVGFKPLEFKDRDDGNGLHFTKQELLEISLVSVPMHPRALRKAMGDGKFSLVVPEGIEAVKWGNADDNISTKAGAAISKATRQALVDVRSTISQAADALEALIRDDPAPIEEPHLKVEEDADPTETQPIEEDLPQEDEVVKLLDTVRKSLEE